MADADRVVVELLAKVDQFDQPVKQSATQFSQSMDRITASATKAEQTVTRSSASRSSALQRESAQISQFTRTLAHDMVGAGDLLTSDRSPFVVPVKQAPAVTAAIKGVALASTALGGVLETLAGVGIALFVASLVSMIGKSKEAADEIDKLVEGLKENHDKAQLAAQAHEIYDRTVEGSIDKANEFTDTIEKQNKTLEDNIELLTAQGAAALKNIYVNIASVGGQLGAALQRVRDAQRDVLRFQGAAGDPNVSPDIAAAYTDALSRFGAAKQEAEGLATQLLKLSQAGEGASKALREVDFPLIERNAKSAADPIAAINRKYDEMADKAKKAGTYTQALADSIERMRQADIKATRSTGGSGESGRELGFDAAAAIARGAGLRVTSAYRSTADQARLFNDPAYNHPGNPVARPGTSAHEGVNGKWALDIAFAPGLSAQSLRKLYGDEGVTLSAVYKESGHFHIEGRRPDAEVASDRAAAKADADRLKALDTMSRKLAEESDKEQEVTVAKEGQREASREILAHAITLDDLLRQGLIPSSKELERYTEQVNASWQELERFGENFIEDVLNPDNWRSWGSIGKTILRDLESEFIRLGAINPLKNLLFGQNNPTLSSIFSLFSGGASAFSGALPTASVAGSITASGVTPVGFFASGGSVSAGKPIVVGERGPEVFVPDSAGMIVPNNSRAAAAFGGMSPATVRVLIEASKYFDGQVLEVAGPVIAQSSVAAANGGATISRRNLSRESQHRLE